MCWVSTRFDKTEASFLGFIRLAAIVVFWL
jgi:hypothetical protein